MFRRACSALALFLLGCTVSDDGRASRAGRSDDTRERLLPAIEIALRQTNPAIDSVAVLSLKSLYPGGEVAVVGWGTHAAASPPRDSQNGWNNELFGVFIFDSRLTTIQRTLDTFPTKSWRDYDVQIERFDRDSVVVFGRSLTYGHQGDRRAYEWK